jgi:phage terminase large subunit
VNAALSKIREWKYSPLIFVTDVIKATPSEQQIELLTAMSNRSIKQISVRSGHGTGKDACTSWIILWFMTVHLNAKVICTAPTSRQLADILWSEIAKWIRKSDLLTEEFEIQKDKIFHKSNPKEWWCRAVSASVKATKEDQAETLAGFHGDDMLIVVDECSGVPDPVFIPLEGALTQENNRVLTIGNMTKNQGYFYDSHFHREISKTWHKLHWNSELSTNVKPEYPTYMANKYGKESNIYRIRVLGEPPLVDDGTYIPLAWAQQCIGNEIGINELDPLYLGVDVARYGDDSSVVLPRRGNNILIWDEYKGMDTVNIAGFVSQTYNELDADGCAVDEIGIGAGVFDILSRRNMKGLHGVNVANSSSDPTQFHRLRDESWGMMRDKCMRAQYSFPSVQIPGEQETYGDRLANELSSVQYSFDNNGAILVESKKQMRQRGVDSPNIADALGVSEVMYSVAHRIWERNSSKGNKKREEKGKTFTYKKGKSTQLWMAS